MAEFCGGAATVSSVAVAMCCCRRAAHRRRQLPTLSLQARRACCTALQALLTLLVVLLAHLVVDAVYWRALTWRAWVTATVLGAVMAALVTNVTTTDVPIVCAAAVLALAGVVDVATAFAGFANPSLLAIAALFPVAAGVTQWGAVASLTRLLFGASPRTWLAVLRISMCAALLSAFVNNTPVVALLIPAVEAFARRRCVRAEYLLMPLSFASILGGSCSIVGTSTNLIVLGLVQKRVPSFTVNFFEIAAVGVPTLAVGLVYCTLLAGSGLLLRPRTVRADGGHGVDAGDASTNASAPLPPQPSHLPLPLTMPIPSSSSSSAAIAFLTNPRAYVVSATVVAGGSACGRSAEQAGLHRCGGRGGGGGGLFLYEIEHAQTHRIVPAPPPDVVLNGGDVLRFAGDVRNVSVLMAHSGIVVDAAAQVRRVGAVGAVGGADGADGAARASGAQAPVPLSTTTTTTMAMAIDAFCDCGRALAEAVVSPMSPCVGRTVRECAFRTRYAAAIVAVHRAGAHVRAACIGDVRLRVGDTLLIVCAPSTLRDLQASSDFCLVAPVSCMYDDDDDKGDGDGDGGDGDEAANAVAAGTARGAPSGGDSCGEGTDGGESNGGGDRGVWCNACATARAVVRTRISTCCTAARVRLVFVYTAGALMVALNAAGLAGLLELATLVVVAFVATHTLDVASARSSINGVVMLTAMGALALASAMESTGLATLWADAAVAALAPLGRFGTLYAVYAATALLTAAVTNAAAAAVVMPLALEIGARQALPMKTLMYTVMLGASASFTTPIGYQTNLMVAGPGGYTLGDFVRFGGPLQLLVSFVTTGCAALVFGLEAGADDPIRASTLARV